jgi:pyruvate kinase
MRFTKIVATIGPATSDPSKIATLIESGMNVARLNFAHGSHESHNRVIDAVHAYNKKHGTAVAVMLDTKGPEIRTGDVHDPINIKRGDEVLFTSQHPANEKRTIVEVNYDEFPKDAKSASTILIDNGVLEFDIIDVSPRGVVAKAKESGAIGTRRHINLPGATISLPSFTKRDWEDIRFGIKKGVDFIAPSFVRSGDDIKELRAFLVKHKSSAHIVAKIETAQGVENLDDIIDLTDGLMVARGDLGAEVPFELVPRLQDEMVLKCRAKGKPVIVATHMLESMCEHPMPTRAELTDIAHAAATHADATMLSGETASGKFPFKAMEAMDLVLSKTEEFEPFALDGLMTVPSHIKELRDEQARAACIMARNLNAKAIIVITKQGRTARSVSAFRVPIPILAFTESDDVRRSLALCWGTQSFTITLSKNPETTVVDALKSAKKAKILTNNDLVIVVSDILTHPHGNNDHVMTVQLRKTL